MPLERVSQGFKDISATFQTNPLNDDLITIKNETAIARSIRNIVFTLPGEKFFDEDFGSNISRALFENIDDISDFFGQKISIKMGKKDTGSISVPFHSKEDFKRILKLLKSD